MLFHLNDRGLSLFFDAQVYNVFTVQCTVHIHMLKDGNYVDRVSKKKKKKSKVMYAMVYKMAALK